MNDLEFLNNSYKDDASQGSNLKVVLVEDDLTLGHTLRKFINKTTNAEVFYFSHPTDCVKSLTSDPRFHDSPFVLITDISFEEGGADGLLLVDLLKDNGLKFVSLVMTGFASIETAIAATKKGVFHYLTKPFDLKELGDLILKAAVEKLGMQEVQVLKQAAVKPTADRASILPCLEAPTEEDMFCGMIGRSKLMKDVFERIKKVAKSDSTVLVTGPSGTGKELVSNAIHKLSNRMDSSLVSVNCGAIPSELLESELFGHEKGAFTGAVSSRKGRFEMADKGTIFLDEIGDMPLLLQVKLLRVIQARVVEKVGSTQTTPIDVRIVTATHRNLEEAVIAGDFREDLFYRLNVIPIRIPALRERKEDVPLLISYFLSRFVSADGRNSIEFDDEALGTLLAYDWPGNVRELENLIERLVILKGGGIIKVEDLPAKFRQGSSFMSSQYGQVIKLPSEGIDLKSTISEIEDSLIIQALEKTKGNKNQASKLLNMNRTTLIEKMKKKGISQLL